MRFSSLEDAKQFLYSTPADFRLDIEWKYARMRYFAALLDETQNRYPSVHIAGTSGKGSTAWILDALLRAHGFRTGLHLSPHTLDYRERCMIDGNLLSENVFLDHLDALLPYIDRMTSSPFGWVGFGEISVALAFFAFLREKVDIAVIETACGGLYDATNILDRPDTLRIITDIGYDHMGILGRTLAQIMHHKAGIIHMKNRVIALQKPDEIQHVLDEAIRRNQADAHVPSERSALDIHESGGEGVRFSIHDDALDIPDIFCAMPGRHQARNAYLAICATHDICMRMGKSFDPEAVRATLRTLSMPGRFDRKILPNGNILILDAAHNPQKMHALVDTLREAYPGICVDGLLGFKEGKQHAAMLDIVSPALDRLFLWEFDVWSNDIKSADMTQIASCAKEQSTIPTAYICDVRKFLHEYGTVPTREKRVLLATGSLYFVSSCYEALSASKSSATYRTTAPSKSASLVR